MIDIWQKYETGLNHHRQSNIIEQSLKNYDFFEGRQWRGVQVANEDDLPRYNIIRQIVSFKYNVISMANVELIFLSDNEDYSNALNAFSSEMWEDLKMQSYLWQVNKSAHIAGDGYLYIYDDNPIESVSKPLKYDSIKCKPIDNVNIFLADEQNSNIQEQAYIIIRERLPVSEVRERAKAYGFKDIDLIVSDEENETDPNRVEVKTEDGKCTSLLYLTKKNGTIHFTRATQNAVYQEETDSGLTLYPVVNLVCNSKKGTARGIGEVEPLIANQILLNKTLFRRGGSVAQVAFPKMVYNEELIENPSELSKTGGIIGVRGLSTAKISEMIGYVQPSYIGNDAKELTDELITLTKEINNSGNGALGQVNPERASGTAIQAVTQQSNISTNEQSAAYEQLIEDIGLIFIEFWKKYNPSGLLTELEGNQIVIPTEELDRIKLKINVSPATPFDRLATDQQLMELFKSGVISFDEFVESLDENTLFPKNKLEEIITKRENQQMLEKDMIIQKQAEILSQYQMNDVTNQQLQGGQNADTR